MEKQNVASVGIVRTKPQLRNTPETFGRSENYKMTPLKNIVVELDVEASNLNILRLRVRKRK